MLWLAHANGEDRGVHGGHSPLELRGCVWSKAAWPYRVGGRGGISSPAETSGIAAHPKAQLPVGCQPLLRMVA